MLQDGAKPSRANAEPLGTGMKNRLRPFLPLLLLLAFGLQPGMAQKPPAGPAALDAYSVKDDHRFEQVRLTPDMVSALLAALPRSAELQSANATKVQELEKMESAVRKTFAIAQARIEIIAALEALAREAGFPDYGAFDNAKMSLVLALDREGFRRHAANVPLAWAELLRAAPPAERRASQDTLKAMERTISAAQQQPLPENVAVVEPFRKDFEALEKRMDVR